MKKKYLFAAFAAFALTANAQLLEDDMESYSEGPISSQSSNWRSWSGGAGDDASVVSTFASSGDQSLLIDDSGATDLLLLVPGTPISGVYSVQFELLVPSGRSFYFNMQAELTPDGQAWNQALMGGNVYFNCDNSSNGSGGVTGVTDCSAFDFVFTYPEDEFFTISNVYDLDNETWSMYINGTEQFSGAPFAFGDQTFEGLTAINFFSASNNNEGYIDDVIIVEGNITLSTNDFSNEVFSVYPNPVVNALNIKSAEAVDNVTIYNVLGQVVSSTNPRVASPSIDTSNLNSGAYLVKVTIGKASKTIKVLK